MRTRTRNLKRLLSLLLCLCLVTGLLPVTVLAADQPVITTETLEGATVGEAYNATLTATASDAKGTLTWKAQGLPNGLALSGSRETAALLGTPTEAGEFTFTVTVTETIPAESEEPAEEPAAEEGETPADAPQPTVLTDTKTYTLTVAKAVQDEPEPEPEPDGNTMEEPGTGDPLLPTDNTDGESLRTTTGTMSAEIYTGQESGTGAFTGKTSTFAAGDTVILHSFKFSPALATDSTAHSIGILPTSETDPNKADVIWYEESSNGTISNKPENNVLQLIGFQLGSNVSPGTYRFVIWAGPDYLNETVYTSTETFTVTGGTGGGTVTASSYTASFAADEAFSDPVTSVAADGTQYYFKADGFSPELNHTQDSAQYSYRVTVRTTAGTEILGLSGKSTVSNTNGVIQSVLKGPDTIDLAPGSYTLVTEIYSVNKSTNESELLFTCTSTNQIVVTAPTVSTPTINTGSLPGGVTGTEYSQPLKATPGTEDKAITWSVTSGRLPDGLTLDIGTGTISGTPTAAGNYTFTVTAKEADGGETSKFFTITITEAITSRELKVGSGSYSPGDRISVRWDMSAGVPEGGEATLTLHYTDTSSQAQTASYEMTRSPLGYFYAYVKLPDDCAGVEKLSASATVSGQTVTAKNNDLDITMKGKLSLTWGTMDTSGTLTIQDSGNNTVSSQFLSKNGGSMAISLPAGEYTLSATISVIGMGDVSVLASPTGPITINAGEIKEQGLTFRATNTVTYQPKVERADDGALYSSGYSLYWYEDADGTKPLGVGYSYTAMADDTLYVQAVPKGTLSATHNKTDVTQATSANMTLTLEAKPANTVTVTVQCADVAGGGTTPLTKVGGTVVLSQPGDDGTTKTTQQWVYSYKPNQVTFTGVTEGSTITFTPNDQYLCGPVSQKITSVTGGSEEISLRAEQLKGVITLNLTVNYEKSTSHPFLSGFYNLTVKKGNTDIPFHRVGNNYLVLDDLNGLNSAELTISGQYGSGDFPIAVFEETVTLSGNKLSATADITMDARGQVVIFTTSREVAVADLLLYQNGKLYYTKGSYITSSTFVGSDSKRSSWSVRLPAGSYTAYVVDRDYLSTVDPETYQTTPSFEAGTYDSASFTIEDKTTQYVNLNAPGIVQSHADVNYEMSSVTGTEDFPGTLTHTTLITLTSNEKLDESEGISLKLYHHQFGGQVSIRSLAINGVPWTKSSGTGLNGRLDLTLSGTELERYGGFPLRISYVIARSDYSELDFESYLFYTNDTGEPRTARVGTFYQEGGDVVLNVPSMVGEKTFFVSGYVPQRGKDVTVYLDGAAVATVQSGSILDRDGSVARYSVTGYFAAQVTLPDDVEEFDTFRVSAAWEEGVSEDMEVMYTATTGVLTCVTLTLNGEPFVLWENGNSVSESWNVFAQSSSTLSWKVEFFNPDKVKNVVVHVPRSDGSELELDASRVGSAFQTETRTFYGAIPTGVYVTYDNELIPRANAKEPISADDFAAGIDALNTSGVISGMEGDQDSLTFTLQNPNGTGTIDVSVESTTEAWDDTTEAELASFDALKEKPEYSTLPSYILYYDEGYMDIYEDDGQEGGYWGSDRICKYSTTSGGTLYQREIYTMGERIIITWDVGAKTTTTHRITLGSGTGSGQPDEKKVTSESEYVQDYQRTAQVEQLWMLFYQQLSDACEKAGTADTLSARTMSLAAPKGGKLSLKVKIDVNKLKEQADALAEDSETWAEGQEITAAEIRQIKDFLDDNPGLVDLYKMHQSTGGDNPYQVVGDIRATYYERGMGLIEKALSLATGKPKDVVDTLKDGIKDYAIDTVKGKIFYRQSEGMVCDLYVAARQAERTETGAGGLLQGGINWSRFPTNIYDPNSSFSAGHNRQTLPNSPRGTYDPSGYVYEAVPSNRVKGAEVNLYTFNESVKAEEWVDSDLYGIEPNPQTTGEDGRYEWFVPEGYWRVVVTKEGYEPVDTGSSQSYGLNATDQLKIGDTTVDTNGQYWMPVLPIQLDVNIPLVSYAAPTVQNVEATAEGVYVTFSKYMVTTLSVDDFKINGTAPDSVEALNAEASSSADNAPEYASIFLLTYPVNEKPAAGEEINVYVNNTVESYADVKMEAPYAKNSVQVLEQLPTAEEPTLAADSPTSDQTVPQNTVVYLTVPADAAVYYTTDGTDPSSSSTRKLYSAVNGIIVDRTMTIKAVAVQAGKANSEVLMLDYSVAGELPEGPTDPEIPVNPVSPGGSGDDDSYSISVPASSSISGGSVTVSPRSAEKGDTVTITVKPDDGYELSKLTVTDAKGNELELTDKGSGKYTFSMPGSSVKIQVSFKEIAEQVTNPFTDVYESDYYYDAVLWAVANGVTAGTSATTFSPNAPVTRAQMVTFLWRAYGSPKATGSNPFADVSADAWYYDAVLWAVANGVTVGTSATTFSPDAPVTRSQAVTFQWRAAGSPVVAGDSFDDVAADAYYAGAVTWAVANGITNGTGGNQFSPDVVVTRAQAVTFLWRELA